MGEEFNYLLKIKKKNTFIGSLLKDKKEMHRLQRYTMFINVMTQDHKGGFFSPINSVLCQLISKGFF